MITFENVTKVYEDGTKALDNVNFHINKGEFVFVVGPSGSGKSTLTRLAATYPPQREHCRSVRYRLRANHQS